MASPPFKKHQLVSSPLNLFKRPVIRSAEGVGHGDREASCEWTQLYSTSEIRCGNLSNMVSIDCLQSIDPRMCDRYACESFQELVVKHDDDKTHCHAFIKVNTTGLAE